MVKISNLWAAFIQKCSWQGIGLIVGIFAGIIAILDFFGIGGFDVSGLLSREGTVGEVFDTWATE